jgi:hypothetical protein
MTSRESVAQDLATITSHLDDANVRQLISFLAEAIEVHRTEELADFVFLEFCDHAF